MKRSIKPRFENLEDRLAMDAAGALAIVKDFVVPAASPMCEVSSRPGIGILKSIDGGQSWNTGSAHSEPLPVLLVIANRDFYI